MRIGIPREVKPGERRVALTPAACAELVDDGHAIQVERGAGLACGFDDAAFSAAGAGIADDAAALYGNAELVLKVKEPVAADLRHLGPDHLLFCFLHLAANPELARRLCELGVTAVGFETVQEDDGRLPILAPMSEIAGRIAVQLGATFLHAHHGGRGVLLGGVAGSGRGRVAVLGGGAAGSAAAEQAAAMGAWVTVFDLKPERLAAAHGIGANVSGHYPHPDALVSGVTQADLVVGAVLVPGARAPVVVDAATVARMQPGAVIVDVSVDQGGCIATTRPTTYEAPTYHEAGIIHCGVTNMPGTVPRTAVEALSAVVPPYVRMLAGGRWRRCPALARAVNVEAGRVVHPALDGIAVT